LTLERDEKQALLGSVDLQWQRVASEVREVREAFSKKTKLGKRRTQFADAPDHTADDIAEALIEKEPVTVVLSQKGFLRALKGHVADLSGLAFRDGDALKLSMPALTTDKLVFLSTDGRAYTLNADKLPGGRGQGDPIRLLVDLEDKEDLLFGFVADTASKRLIVSSDGNGFVVNEGELVSGMRRGKQVLNLAGTARLAAAERIAGDTVAVIGENRKLTVFPLIQVPEMTRGKGVRLQRFKDGGLADVKTFRLADGLTWTDTAGRVFNRNEEELREWYGDRAQAGRLVPKGFPKSGRFT